MNRRLGTLAFSAGAVLLTAMPASGQVVVEEIVCKDDECEVRTGQDQVHVIMRSAGQNGVMLGIGIDPLQDEESDAYGVLVISVTEDGPAEAAGLLKGDIITSLHGHRLTEPLDHEADLGFDGDRSLPLQRLQAIMKEVEEGQAIEVSYRRDGETATTSVTVEVLDFPTMLSFGGQGANWMTPNGGRIRMEQHGDPRVFEFRTPRSEAGGGAIRLHRDGGDQDVRVMFRGDLDRLGTGGARAWSLGPDAGVLRLGDTKCGGFGGLLMTAGLGCVDGARMISLNPELGEYFGVDSGVLVTEVDEESSLGLRPGDVLLRIGGREVRDPDHAARILASYDKDEAVSMTVRRNSREITVEGSRG